MNAGEATGSDGLKRLGESLGPYKILGLLGAGGMGEVYRALDPRLGREVAVKVLPEGSANDPERLSRFEHEARAVAALSHPNIVSIHDFGSGNGVAFAVMELLEGGTLGSRLAPGPLPLRTAVEYAIQLASGLAAAHKRGVIHRDLKPDNVFVTNDGRVKILDFGLAKLRPELDESATSQAQTATEITGKGTVLGTAGYMSPEQVRGKPADQRSDIFAFGTILYEMVSGRRCFRGETTAETMATILTLEPADLDKSIPESLDRIIRHCLEKNPQLRFQSIQDVAFALEHATTGGSLSSWAKSVVTRSRTGGIRRVAIYLGLSIGVAVVGGWFWRRSSRERWVHEKATPEIERLVDAQEFAEAARLAREARAVLPQDRTLERLWMRSTEEASIESLPPGAEVLIRPYREDVDTWQKLGNTPLEKVRVPRQEYVWRVAASGYAPMSFIDGSPRPNGSIEWTLKLRPEGSVPPGMVTVPGQKTGLGYPVGQAPIVALEDYLIDQHEVTNEEYKRFVDEGGYRKREFWKQPFVRERRVIPWEEAVSLFIDTTGRPGPATWEVGSYLKGLEKHPVAGVSWYEAAAYAEFVGKSLPTIYHWTAASQSDRAALITARSNFRGLSTHPVGGPGTMSGFGTTDMAGNVKEWCWNEARQGKKFIMGGGYGESIYMFFQLDAQLPWVRRPNYGFRCVKLDSPATTLAAARIEATSRDYSKEKPVSDDVFKAYAGLYAYDKADLNSRREKSEALQGWTYEKASIDAAYGGERMSLHVYLPRNAAPPFQAVVYFGGTPAGPDEKFDPSFIEDYRDFAPKSGRALIVPTYKGTFERWDGFQPDDKSPALFRDHVLMWSKDLGRSLDYLQTRKDIDSTKIAYFGFSRGAVFGPVFLAVEKRFKAAILSAGGLQLSRHDLPEADAFNFAQRVTTPTLMLNGRYDDYFVLESSQLPLFRLLGTPANDKKHVLYDSGHDLPHKEEVRETLDWLDKYLGPVTRSQQ